MKKTIYYLMILAISISLFSCGGGIKKITKNPLDSIAKAMAKVPNYVVVLDNMDFNKKKNHYEHKYQIFETKQRKDLIGDTLVVDTIVSRKTKWLPVSDKLFKQYEKDLGMELLSQKDGRLSKVVSPIGYSQYVGNERYGRWDNDNTGHSTWHFFGQYMFMRTMLRMAFFPVRYSNYSTYRNFNRAGKTYYGSGVYGSSGRYNKKTGRTSRWSSRPKSFRTNVRSKTSRKSSRYRGSRSRSRSGGFGK